MKRIPALLLVALLTLSWGCQRARGPVRVGLLVWPPYELFLLAEGLGHYDGVAVQFVDYRTPAEALQAYQNGVIDAVAMTTEFLVQLAQAESGHCAVLVIDHSRGGDALIGRPGIESVAELRGGTVGLEKSVLGHRMLTEALAGVGVGIEEIELVFLDMPDQVAAFAANRVDAVVTYEPTVTRLRALGGTALFDSASVAAPITDVLITRAKLLAEREAVLRAIVDGYFEALDFLRREPAAAAARCAPREQLTPEQFLSVISNQSLPDRAANRRLLGGARPELADALVAAQLSVGGPTVSLPGLMDDRLVRSR